MYCPRCGEANDDSDRFCSACGQDLTTYQRLWQEPGSQTPGQSPQTPRPSVSSGQVTAYRPAPPADAVPRIPSYLGWAIVVLICCFWPTGIAAVVHASRVDNKVAFGDLAGAQESSRRAKMWCWITFGIGVAIWVLSLAITIWFSWMLATRHVGAGGLFV